MKLEDVANLAYQLMGQHGLLRDGWTFAIGRKRRSLGTCYYDSKQIVIHYYFAEHGTEEQIRETILHEIAHALAGWQVQAHGPEWQEIARRIGCKETTRCATDPAIPMAEGTYQAICFNCGQRFHYYRKPTYKGERWCNKPGCGREKGKLTIMSAERIRPILEKMGAIPKKKSFFD